MPRVDDLLDYLRGRRPACAGCGERLPVREVEQGVMRGWWCQDCIDMMVRFAGSVVPPRRPTEDLSHDVVHFAPIPGCPDCGVRWRPA